MTSHTIKGALDAPAADSALSFDEVEAAGLDGTLRTISAADIAMADAIRKDMIATGQPAADLAADTGPTWTTAEMQVEFEVLGFQAPIVVVRRRSDGQLGSLEFTHSPRVYFGWDAHS